MTYIICPVIVAPVMDAAGSGQLALLCKKQINKTDKKNFLQWLYLSICQALLCRSIYFSRPSAWLQPCFFVSLC